MKKKSVFGTGILISIFFLITQAVFVSCASRGTVQAEEYYTIGMAFFDLGRYEDAEMWLNRARAADKTMVASEYNLGRIAFERGRFEEASKYFETILERDPDNVMVLKAAAYSRTKNGNIDKAETLYTRVLELVPESADDGFNYALVLYGMEKYEASEEVLNRYPFALEEKPQSILLLARAQSALNKVEAVDSYAKWVTVNTGTPGSQGLYEYAQTLEKAGLYAKALEQYKEAITAHTKDTETLKKSSIIFAQARLLLTEDPENDEGLAELNNAVKEGFSDLDAIEALMKNEKIGSDTMDEIRRIWENLLDLESKNSKESEDETEETGEES